MADSKAFPRVWRRFERARSGDGTRLKFRIQDCPVEMYDEYMEFMCEYFMKEETLNRTFDIAGDALAIREFRELQSSYLSERLALICVSDEDNDPGVTSSDLRILGLNLLTVASKKANSGRPPVRSHAMRRLYQVFDELSAMDDAFERFGVEELLGDAGLSTHPECRGMSMARELLEAKHSLCLDLGLRVSAASFTYCISQRVAAKAGYESYGELSYERIEEITGTSFAGTTTNPRTTHVKLMAWVAPS